MGQHHKPGGGAAAQGDAAALPEADGRRPRPYALRA